MKTIWKFPLNLNGGDQVVEMPKGANIVHIAMQFGNPTLWAVIDEAKAKEIEPRIFMVTGTGWGVQSYCEYIGTCKDGGFVWHVWEV